MIILILDILAFVFLVYLVSNLLYYFRIILIASGIFILIWVFIHAIRYFRKQKNINSEIHIYDEETSLSYNDFTIDTNIVGDAEKENIEDDNEKQNHILEKEKIKKDHQTENHNSSLSREEALIYGAYCNKGLRHNDIQCMEEEYKKYASFSNETTKKNDEEKETE